MKGLKIGAIGIIMMLMSISVVYSQTQTDQAIIAGLLVKRDRLTAEMDAEIIAKDAFMTAATKVCTATECTYTIKSDTRVLKEILDSGGHVLSDVFTDPANKMVLTTNYTSNHGVICYTLLNNDKKDKLNVCNPCPLARTDQLTTQAAAQTYGAFQDQIVWDLKTGATLKIKVNCCGTILAQGYCDFLHTGECEFRL